MCRHFNPRSSCEERPVDGFHRYSVMLFQSTLLMRGATATRLSKWRRPSHFNPRSSCEERRYRIFCHHVVDHISIHAPHARSDVTFVASTASYSNFNPRSSCEERRGMPGPPIPLIDFNPRSSCEERRSRSVVGFSLSRFQSTLLMRGATRKPAQ